MQVQKHPDFRWLALLPPGFYNALDNWFRETDNRPGCRGCFSLALGKDCPRPHKRDTKHATQLWHLRKYRSSNAAVPHIYAAAHCRPQQSYCFCTVSYKHTCRHVKALVGNIKLCWVGAVFHGWQRGLAGGGTGTTDKLSIHILEQRRQDCRSGWSTAWTSAADCARKATGWNTRLRIAVNV